MTGSNDFALPLCLMGMHKSSLCLCLPLCAEVGEASCHQAKDTVRTLVLVCAVC